MGDGEGKVLKNGKPPRMIGVFVDLTSIIVSNRNSPGLSGRLIHAPEEERIRLSANCTTASRSRVALQAAELSLLRRQLEGRTG